MQGAAMNRAVRCAAFLFSLSTLAVFALSGAPAGAAVTAPLPTANATSWNGVVPTPPGSPPGSVQSDIDAVSCTTSTFCVAVGTQQGVDASFIEQWNGKTWTPVANTPSSSTVPTLSGVSCIGTSFCVAVGTTTAGAIVVDQWNGTSWTAA